MASSGERIPNVRKIAVLRANAIGDFVFVLPALESLRAAYPNAEIVLLAKTWHADMLDARPSPVDRVIVVPPYRGVSIMPDEGVTEDLRALERFFAQMQNEKFDLALQMHGGGRYSNPFVRRLGARLTVGASTPDALPLDRSIPYIYFQPEMTRYLEITALVGAPAVTLSPRITVTSLDLVEARRVMPESERLLAVLHPGAGDPRRRWPVERFAALGDALDAEGMQVVVVGTNPERHLVEGVVNGMQAPATGLCDRLSPGGLIGLLARCTLFVGNDSGPLHLAAAVGATALGIYWCGNVITAGHLTRARFRPLISWCLNCPLCGSNCMSAPCDHRVSFVADVSVDEALRALGEMIHANA